MERIISGGVPQDLRAHFAEERDSLFRTKAILDDLAPTHFIIACRPMLRLSARSHHAGGSGNDLMVSESVSGGTANCLSTGLR
jgi:hypothetical protein